VGARNKIRSKKSKNPIKTQVRQKLQVSRARIFIRYFFFILLPMMPGKKLRILLILCFSVVEKIHFSILVAK
jgi:hypothetical protein